MAQCQPSLASKEKTNPSEVLEITFPVTSQKQYSQHSGVDPQAGTPAALFSFFYEWPSATNIGLAI